MRDVKAGAIELEGIVCLAGEGRTLWMFGWTT